MLFTEPWLGADEAVEAGLALRTVEPDRLMDEVMGLARHIGSLPLAPVVATKTLMVAARIEAVQAARRRESAEFRHLVAALTEGQ